MMMMMMIIYNHDKPYNNLSDDSVGVWPSYYIEHLDRHHKAKALCCIHSHHAPNCLPQRSMFDYMETATHLGAKRFTDKQRIVGLCSLYHIANHLPRLLAVYNEMRNFHLCEFLVNNRILLFGCIPTNVDGHWLAILLGRSKVQINHCAW